MTADEIPADVRAFVRAYIPSVVHMEALVLTVADPNELWTVESIARRLFVPEAKAGAVMRELAASGLLQANPPLERWRFAPTSEMLAELATHTVRLYRQRLLVMTALIRSGTDAGGQLANAFRFRKE